ncbi:MAG: TMEM14 family protein [Candidatus Omnitrophota bacterium]|nr:TMEM14 family protein [Candidatus Omnitrophota bacterium]MDZ4243332.1 TMEM14 family protein [Candidatus Omnitrophota bacterium]
MLDKFVLIGYGVFMLVGAFFGWKAGSKVSLIMGIVSGAAVFLSYAVSLNAPRNGILGLAVISGILSGVFLLRLIQTQKMMPAGMLLAVSAAVFAYGLYRFINYK